MPRVERKHHRVDFILASIDETENGTSYERGPGKRAKRLVLMVE
jgi:hypothetical protein